MLPLKDTIRSRSFPLVNWLIIAANALVFVVYEVGLPEAQLQRLALQYGLVPARLLAGQPAAYLSLFTHMFLHGGWLHLVSNLWALYIFGDNVEDRMGSARYLVFYLLGGLAAGVAQSLVAANSTLPLIGASGAIAAVLGAYLVLYPRARVITLVPIFLLPWFVEIPAVVYLLVWFALQFFSGVTSLGMASQGGVGYWAHIGGFTAGLLLVPFFSRRPRAAVRWYPDEHLPW